MRYFILMLLMSLCSFSLRGEVLVKDGEKIAFLGDSITQLGNSSNIGYVNLVIDGLKQSGISAEKVPAGIGGHKSDNMLQRVDNDVIKKEVDWMLLSCGVNDVWHQDSGRGVMLDDYKRNITEIVDKAQKANIKVVILTASMITENPQDKRNKKLTPYNDFLRELAKERKLLLADINQAMQQQIKASSAPGNKLTVDGVHMNPFGNIMMAATILKTLGVEDSKLEQIKLVWNDQPNTMTQNIYFSINELNTLKSAAAAKNMTINDYIRSCIPELNRPQSSPSAAQTKE